MYFTKETEESNLIIGGDFNAKIKEKGNLTFLETMEYKRNTKDKKKNKEGKNY